MSKKILVVDDEDHIVELIKSILELEDYEVETANNGEDAISKLESFTPDLILLDMMMPGMSGREVAQNIRKNPNTKDLKIAFVTVVQFSETGKQILKELNVIDYITKPFTNEELLDRIGKILA